MFLLFFVSLLNTPHSSLDFPPHSPLQTMPESIHASDLSLDHDIELIEHEDGNAKYSTQTIRQKQGRQVVSSFTTTSSSSEDIAAETDANGVTTSGKKTTTTTKTTTHSKAPVQIFPSVGFYQGLGRLQAISGLGFAAFAFVHVIPPVLAAFGGVDLANKALIWGRVYYQVSFYLLLPRNGPTQELKGQTGAGGNIHFWRCLLFEEKKMPSPLSSRLYCVVSMGN